MSELFLKSQAAIEALSGARRFELLVDAVKDYAIYLLDPEGFVSSWNTGAQRFKGYSADEIIGQHFSRFYTDEDRAAGLPQLALETAVREGKFEAEGWRVRKDGTHFWTSAVIEPIKDPDDNVIGFAKVTRDITERRRAQEEIERAREALHQAQKMEAVGRLTGGVAHDFNNLLTIIRSSIDLLRRPGLTEEKKARYLEAIAETADRAALLTGQLLAFARRQPLRPEVFNVAQRIQGLEQIIQTSLGSPIRVSVELADGDGMVEADPNQFETAVLNIVINARDAMPSGGALAIRVRSCDGPATIEAGKRQCDTFMAVSITDDGTGMNQDTLERIFEPFFTTKELNKGTGLGLSQVYGFVKQSGGEIEVQSRLGAGTTFTLFLPRASDDKTASAAPARPAKDRLRDLQTANVLLVEDNLKVGEFAENLLRELGQSVTWVVDAKSTLELLEQNRDAFDIVFSDVVMPGVNGVELAQQIRQRWPDLPVVLTSGYSHILAEEGSHGFDLLQKPYSIESLIQVLGNLGPDAQTDPAQ
jgi:PAS domain S-box-containing protein